MASFRRTMKQCLFEYPTIFPNPLNVCIHLFCVIGNGYHWHKGQLVDRVGHFKMPEGLKYPTEDFSKGWSKKLIQSSGIRLKDLARVHTMEFIEENIEAILDADPTNVYFGAEDQDRHFVTKGICIEYAAGLQFPDDIKQDWGKALYRFLNWWLSQLHHVYGITAEGWPADIQEAYKAISDARVRLHPLVHNGETYAEHTARWKAQVERIMMDIKRKE